MSSQKYNLPDLDLDLSAKSREEMLKKLNYIPASKIGENSITPHNIGVYFCDIPIDRISGLASIDYKIAEEKYGFIKFDLLHNSIYDGFNNQQELEEILKQDVDWDKFYDKEIVEQLPHISNYFDLLNQLPKIDSVERLAMFIAIIRPGKKHLIDNVKKNGWDSILNQIWVKDTEKYMYKKSHAIAYALSIIIALYKILHSA